MDYSSLYLQKNKSFVIFFMDGSKPKEVFGKIFVPGNGTLEIWNEPPHGSHELIETFNMSVIRSWAPVTQ